MPKYDGVIYKRYNGTSWDIINFAPAPHTHSEYLPKITYEWNKEIVATSGYYVIGPFYCDSSIILLEIFGSQTTNGAAHILQILIRTSSVDSNNYMNLTATEHLSVLGYLPKIYKVNNAVTIVHGPTLGKPSYSIHIKALNLASIPDETTLFTHYPTMSSLPDFSEATLMPIEHVLYPHTVTGTPRLGEKTFNSQLTSFNAKNKTGFYYYMSGTAAPTSIMGNCLVINHNDDMIHTLAFPTSSTADNPSNIYYRVQWYSISSPDYVLGIWQKLAFIKDVNSTVDTAINNIPTPDTYRLNIIDLSVVEGTLPLGGGSIELSNGMTLNLTDNITGEGEDQDVVVTISIDEYIDDGGHIWFALVAEDNTVLMNSTESIYEGQALDDMINNGSEDTGYCIKVFGCADTSDYMVTNKYGTYDLDNLYEGVSLLATITYDNSEKIWRIVS